LAHAHPLEAPGRPTTVRRRMLAGLLALLTVSAIAVTLAVSAARDVTAALGQVTRLADETSRICHVAGQLREFYMHQAHLALGMHAPEHLALARQARTELGRALDALEGSQVVTAADLGAVRAILGRLDSAFENRFLPALLADRQAEAQHAHHEAAAVVQEAVNLLGKLEATSAHSIVEARQQAANQTQRATWLSAGVLATACALAVAIAFWMARSITTPLARLGSAARDLPRAPEGTRVPATGPAEVATLGTTLNSMLAELELQRRARTEAETLAALGRIAAGIAHEINNPLGAILGHARLIERRADGAAEDAAVIAREALACQHIVQDLLDYARPGLAVAQTLDLGELVEATVERIERSEVRLEVAPDLPAVVGDARRLAQLVRNLVENACAFATHVDVHVFSAENQVVVQIDDNGPGVAAEAVERVFEPFFSTRTGGLGLGLAIARSVAIAHGAQLSVAPGPGGHFTLRMPVRKEA